MKMLSSLNTYNKEKKINCLINSWNIEGFKVFALHRFSFSALLYISYGSAPLFLQKNTLCFFDKRSFWKQARFGCLASFACTSSLKAGLLKTQGGFKGVLKVKMQPAKPQEIQAVNKAVNKAENQRSFCTVQANMQSSNSSHCAFGAVSKQNDEKIVNFSKKHKLFNKKLSYLSSSSSPTAKDLRTKNLGFKPFADQEGSNSFTQGKGKAIEQSLILEEKKGFLEKSENFKRKTKSDILNMRNTGQDSKLVKMEYSLETFQRSNQDTCLTHKPSVFEGTWVQSGDLLTDCASSVGGELSLGQNLLIAYMPWEGYNFEDAILISERLVRDDLYTSVHIERYELETLRLQRSAPLVQALESKASTESKQQTKLGAEEITRNIPDVSEKEIQKLDSYGIIKLGSWVEEGDILVGKITPINKKTISPYQKLLYTILEKQVKPIKDSSLRAPKGIKAKVVDIKYFLRKNSTLNLTKSTTSQSSTTLAKQEFYKKNKQSLTASASTVQPAKQAIEGLQKKPEKTLVNSSTVRLLAGQTANSQKWAYNISTQKQKEKFGALLTPEFQKTHSSSPSQREGEEANRKFWKSAFLLYKQRMEHNKRLYLNKINKTYLNLFYKTQTLAPLPLFNRRKSLIVLNSFLPFLQRLKTKYKSPKSLNFLNLKNLYLRKAKSFLEQEKEKYIIKGKHVVKQNPISALLLPSRLWRSLHAVPALQKPKGYVGSPKEILRTQTERPSQKFVKKGKFPIASLTYASGNKRKDYSKGYSLNRVGCADGASKARRSEIIQNMEAIHIYLAEKRKIQVGDKVAGRHGNKGIVSQILPIQDMPYLPDGTPIDMVLNPLGVPSRMNVGQIYECLLGLAGKYLGENYKIPSFDEAYGSDASRSFVFNKLFQARMQTGANWLFDPNSPGKMRLYDGRNGECFLQPVTVGQAYILRLVHMVDDKIHARSTGPYSLVTQQPLRGRSKQGGQRLGEMEVWALEGYGAAFTLLEMLTIKSDDMTGRMTLWSNLILNKDIAIGTPESFKVLVCELQALCLDIGLFRYSQPMPLTPSAAPQLSVSGGSESTKQGNVKDFNKFSLREINSLINLP